MKLSRFCGEVELQVDEAGVLEQVAYEVVDHDELTGASIEESYVLSHNHPPRPGTEAYFESLLPYLEALFSFFDPSPEDVTF